MNRKTHEVTFRHGLGDCVNFALQLPMYGRRGFEVAVQCSADKAILFQAAGVRVDAKGTGAAQVPWGHARSARDGDFSPLHVWNKAAHNLGAAPLPKLDGERGALWREFLDVRLDVRGLIPAEVWRETDAFLRDLPRPVVLLHTMGNAVQEAKNLTREVTLELYRALLDGMDGTLVLLDWDNRVPRMASGRVRHLTDDFRRVDVAGLLALLDRAELLVGIDSGPMHCTRLTGTPGLAVFPNAGHAPHSYMAPRPGLACVMPKAGPGHPSRVHRHALQVIEAREREVDGGLIARQALRMLGGPRFFPREKIGADVQLRYFIEELERGGRNVLSEYTDRHRGFDVLLRELRERPAAVMIETGCARGDDDWNGAGMSTVLLGAFASHCGGSLVSVDNDAGHCALARKLTHEMPAVSVVEGDSVKYLTEWRGKEADLIYCDSLDADHAESAAHGLAEAKAAVRVAGARGLIAFDDTVYRAREFHGKGRLAVPWLLEQGWRMVWSGYQTILCRA